MRPMAAAAAGALIAGVAVYAVNARAAQTPFAEVPAYVQTVDGQLIRVPGAQPVGYGSQPIGYGYTTALQPAAPAPVVVRRAAVPQQTVYRTVTPAQERVVTTEAEKPKRSWKKTTMVIGGSAAGGAGIGAIVGGKTGALIGAALGGGAASIYEATRR